MFRYSAISVLIISLITPIFSFADTIVLKNGNKLSGTIHDFDQEPFYLELPYGKISFSHKEIIDAQFDDANFKQDSLAVKKLMNAASKKKDHKEKLPPLSAAQLKKYKKLLYALEEQNNEDEDWGYTPERKKIVQGFIKLGPNVSPYLEKELNKGHADNAEYLLRALVGASQKRGAKTTSELVSSAKYSKVRIAAITVLGDTNAELYQAEIALGLEDKLASVRIESLRNLALVKNVSNAKIMVKYLSDPVRNVRTVAQHSLEEVTGLSLNSDEEWNAWFDSQPAEPPSK